MAKILVVFYSRTGITRTVAGEISRLLSCDCEEIIDLKDRSGPAGYMGAAKDALLKRPTEIGQVSKNPGDYDLVIFGTPVWAFTMAPAIRTYIDRNKEGIKKTAFFCTQGGSGSERTFREMESACGKKPLSTLVFNEKEVKGGEISVRTGQFVEDIRKQLES